MSQSLIHQVNDSNKEIDIGNLDKFELSQSLIHQVNDSNGLTESGWMESGKSRNPLFIRSMIPTVHGAIRDKWASLKSQSLIHQVNDSNKSVFTYGNVAYNVAIPYSSGQ